MKNIQIIKKNSSQAFKILLSISRKRFPETGKIKKILSVGCGRYGIEAMEIAKLMPKAQAFGVDINLENNLQPPKNCKLIRSDFQKVAFKNEKFDLIYCFHVLEHFKNYKAALKKISSLLSQDGILVVGFPNRNRIISYINPIQPRLILEKIALNLSDFGKRLGGGFHSPSAHAGFEESKFIEIADCLFSRTIPIRTHFYIKKYPKFTPLIKLIRNIGIDERLFPSNYFVAKK